jgi:hypothetical protein
VGSGSRERFAFLELYLDSGECFEDCLCKSSQVVVLAVLRLLI